tara:strand:+ start:1740 stop:2231 length:492 start_codon:yes stop_codon:yes gene_type:complete
MVLHNIDEANFDAVAEIYAEGIETGKATFETNVPSWSSWDDSHFPFGRIAAYITGNMLGWASLSPVSSRCVYAGVAEVSVYVSQDARGKGVGKLLLESLIDISEENGIWTLQSGIFPSNTSSIALHEKCGFRKIGYRERIGKLRDNWYDNVLMERRSSIIGIT